MLRKLVTLAGSALIAAALTTAAAGAGDPVKGKDTYKTLCEQCHGPEGKGDGPTGQALAAQGVHPRDFSKGEFKFDTDGDGKTGTDADLKNVLRHGAAQYGGSALMAAFGASMSDQDLDNLVAYVHSLKK